MRAKPDRTAIVTGAASGIGAAIRRSLSADGFHVLAIDKASMEAGGFGSELTIDLRYVGDRELESIEAALEEAPPLTAVCCAAGMRTASGLEVETAEQLVDMFVVNCVSAYQIVQRMLPRLANTKGSVAFVGSPSAHGDVVAPGYAASKAALHAIARSLALALLGRHIRVNVVSPGFTETAMTAQTPEGRRAAAAARNVAGRTNTPDDVAESVRWLLSTATISGSVIDIGCVATLPARVSVNEVTAHHG